MSNATVSSKGAPQMSPRGTERVRRREDQAQHVEQALAEGAALTSPGGPAKEAQIKQNRAQDVARFGSTKATRRLALQGENAAKAEAEGTTLIAPMHQRPALPPIGQQVDLLTANRMARVHDHEERDIISTAARRAGAAVRDTLQGRVPQGTGPEARARRVERHNAAVAAAKK